MKTLGENTGIDTPLSTYVARHTFAQTLRQKGTPTAVISQAMGHKTEAVTAIYLDSFESEYLIWLTKPCRDILKSKTN